MSQRAFGILSDDQGQWAESVRFFAGTFCSNEVSSEEPRICSSAVQ